MVECPYCDHENEVCHDDGMHYTQDVAHQMECSSCGKNFVFQTVICFDYYADKADCLNGGGHDYKPTNTFPIEFTRMRCNMCDDERKCTEDEMQEVLKIRIK